MAKRTDFLKNITLKQNVLGEMLGGVLVYRADESEEILYANERLLRIFGCDDMLEFLSLTGGSFKTLPCPEDRQRVAEEIREQIVRTEGRMDFVQYGVFRKDGTRIHVEEFGHVVDSEQYGRLFYVYFMESVQGDAPQDQDGRHPWGFELEEETLKGLSMRNGFYNAARKVRKHYNDDKEEGRELAVLYVSIVNFCAISTQQEEDHCVTFLQEVENNLKHLFPHDIVAHFYSDIFVILTEAVDLRRKGSKIRCMVRLLHPKGVDVSVGACVWSNHEMKIETLCLLAKAASDDNRKHNNTYFSIYTKDLGDLLQISDYVVLNIEDALRSRRVKVYYQPLIRAVSGQVCGLEALARWEDPVYGLLSPKAFIKPLETSELIWKLDLYVIEQVLKDMSVRIKKGLVEVPVCVNLSRLDFICCDIFAEVEQLVRQYRMPKELLRLEITESALTSNDLRIHEAVIAFQSAGYDIWMDDFGSGYSSFGELNNHEFNALKIDLAFLHNYSGKSRSIIKSVIFMNKKLGLESVVEGVETKEQVDYLRSIGCDRLQGYYFAKPQPLDCLIASCKKKGLVMETPQERLFFREVSKVNFVADEPMLITEYREGKVVVLMVNESCIKSMDKYEFSSVANLQEYLDCWHNPSVRELRKVIEYAIVTHKRGTVFMPLKDKEVLVHYELLGTLDNRSLFVLKTFGQVGEMDLPSQKARTMIKMKYFYNYLFLIDLDRNAIASMPFRGYDEDEPASFFELKVSDGSFPIILPAIFPADEHRYRDFLNPDTLLARLEDTRTEYLSGLFRTKSVDGQFLWMVHRVHLLPSGEHREAVYGLQPVSSKEILDNAQLVQNPHYGSLTGTPVQQNSMDAIWLDNLKLHSPIPFFWKDEHRRFIGATQSFLNIYGFDSLDEILGKTDEDLEWHPNNTLYRQKEEEIIRKGVMFEAIPGQCIIRGITHEIYATKWPIYKDGRICGLMGFFVADHMIPSTLGKDMNQFFKSNQEAVQGEVSDMRHFFDYYIRFESEYRLLKRSFGIIFVSVPRLKSLADNYGMAFYQDALRLCGRIIMEVVGSSGSTSHLGATDFAVITAYRSKEELQKKSDRIKQQLEDIREIDSKPCTLYVNVWEMYAENMTDLRQNVFNTLVTRHQLTKTDNRTKGILPDEFKSLVTLLDAMPMAGYIQRTDRTFLYWNKRAEELMGYSSQEMLGKTCADQPLGCKHLNGNPMIFGQCLGADALFHDCSRTEKVILRHKNGTEICVLKSVIPLKNLKGKTVAMLSFFYPVDELASQTKILGKEIQRLQLDVESQERRNAELVKKIKILTAEKTAMVYEVRRDALTGLHNRVGLDEEMIARLENFPDSYAAMVAIDIDNFKGVNDTYGHMAGDEVLRNLARYILRVFSKDAVASRCGGDEYQIFLTGSPQQTRECVEKLCNLDHQATYEGKTIPYTISIGYAEYPAHTTSVRKLYSFADFALYEAKRNGKNTWVLYDVQMGGGRR